MLCTHAPSAAVSRTVSRMATPNVDNDDWSRRSVVLCVHEWWCWLRWPKWVANYIIHFRNAVMDGIAAVAKVIGRRERQLCWQRKAGSAVGHILFCWCWLAMGPHIHWKTPYRQNYSRGSFPAKILSQIRSYCLDIYHFTSYVPCFLLELSFTEFKSHKESWQFWWRWLSWVSRDSSSS